MANTSAPFPSNSPSSQTLFPFLFLPASRRRANRLYGPCNSCPRLLGRRSHRACIRGTPGHTSYRRCRRTSRSRRAQLFLRPQRLSSLPWRPLPFHRRGRIPRHSPSHHLLVSGPPLAGLASLSGPHVPPRRFRLSSSHPSRCLLLHPHSPPLAVPSPLLCLGHFSVD